MTGTCLATRGRVYFFFFFQAEDGIRDLYVTGVQTCALPISERAARQPGEHQREERAGGGHDRPPAHPDELLPTRVLFYAHEEAGRPEGAAADFQVPPAIAPAAQHAYPVRPQVRFHGAEPLVLVKPVFTPHRDGV